MKIFYIITKSERGGAQTHIAQLSKHFLEEKKEIGPSSSKRSQSPAEIAVMSYPGGWLERHVKKMGGTFYPNPHLSNSINPFQDFKAVSKIKKAVEEFQPDLVSIHSTKAGFLGRLALKNKVPVVFTAHGWGFSEGVSIFRKYIIILVEKLASRFCSCIICVSEFDKQMALEHKIAPEDKLVTIYNGIEVEESPSPGSSKQKSRSCIRIVFIGRFSKQKDPLLLLKAFRDLREDLKKNVEVSIIGEGPRKPFLERFIKDNQLKEVELMGSLSRERVKNILGKSDIFVLTSNWEGFPYSVLEAMSYGLAVVASDVGGVSEIVGNKVGILIKRGDKNSLENNLEKLIEDSKLRNQLGEKAFNRVKEKFSLERMLKKTEKVYRSVLES